MADYPIPGRNPQPSVPDDAITPASVENSRGVPTGLKRKNGRLQVDAESSEIVTIRRLLEDLLVEFQILNLNVKQLVQDPVGHGSL